MPRRLAQHMATIAYCYPSDTLASAALGNFLANFIYDAFFRPAKINDGRTANSDIYVDFADDATWLRLNWEF